MYTICRESFENPLMTELVFEEFYSPIRTCFHEIDRIIEENFAPSLNIEDVEAEMFGEAKDNTSKSGGVPTPNSVARKLGNAINRLIEKLKEAGRKFISMFTKQDKEFDKMSADVRKAIREHPELKDQIILNAKEGSLMMRDLKEMQEFEKDYQKLKAETNPSKIKAGLAKLKHKFDDPENTKTLKRVGAAATVVGLATGLFVMVKKFDDAANVIKKGNDDDIKKAQEFRDLLKNEGINITNADQINVEKLRLEYGSNMHYKYMSKLRTHRGKVLGRCGQMLNKISKGKYKERGSTKRKTSYSDIMAKASAGDIYDINIKLKNVQPGSDEYKRLRKDLKRAQTSFDYFDQRKWKGTK